MEIFFWEDGDRLKWKWIHFFNSRPTLFIFFLFVILVLQNTSRPTPSAYPNPTRKYHISFLLSSRHEATATVQTPKSKLLFHIKSYINSFFFFFFFFFLIDYIDRIFFFFWGDILIDFNKLNHAIIKTLFTKKKKKMLLLKLYYLI